MANKRSQLVEAADKLAYRQGFHRTTLADVAAEAQVLLGNVYYYFKTKEELGQALIEGRVEHCRAVRAKWDAEPDPRRRLVAFVQMAIDDRAALAESGCPIGSLCQELHKNAGPLAASATGLFSEFLAWLEAQFQALGKGRESGPLAVHLLSALQGASLLTHAFHDPSYVVGEGKRLQRWIRTV